MIYEIVNDAVQSLANQWRELSEALGKLAGSLPDTDPNEKQITNQITNLKTRASNEETGLRTEAEVLTSLSGKSLFLEGDRISRDSMAELDRIERDFFGDELTSGLFPFDATESEPVEVAVCRLEIRQLRTFLSKVSQEFQEVLTEEGARFHLGGIHGGVNNLASYPILTSEVGFGYSTPVPGSGVSGELPLQRTVEQALREVLGRNPRTQDTRSFLAALRQSFEVREVEGHTETRWTPRSFAGQSDLGGGVTGYQASLYVRASQALDTTLPLLDGLYPLLPNPDPELGRAARAIVRAELAAVVNELGQEGGPRISRVDGLFASLLDRKVLDDNNVRVRGHLGYLKYVLGLTQDQINDLEEEVNVSNYILLVQTVENLRSSWDEFRDQWLGRDLGTRLVQLSRALSVAAETVEEVYSAMNSVFVGPAERQVAAFRDRNGHTILIEELLSWVTSFTAEEATGLVHDGGRRGAAAIIPTAQTLSELVQQLIHSIRYDPSLPAGLRHPRVLPPLRELNTYLEQVIKLAQDIVRPLQNPEPVRSVPGTIPVPNRQPVAAGGVINP
jgi:hypothetical protein